MNHSLGQTTPAPVPVLSDDNALDVLFEVDEPEDQNTPDLPESADPPEVLDSFQADVICMKMLYCQDRLNEIDTLYRQELEHLNHWKERRAGIIQRKYDYFSQSLEAWLTISGQKSVNLPHGDLLFRKQPVRVEVLDEQAIIAAGQYVRISRSVDKTAILKHFKESGEIIHGINIIEPEPKFNLKLKPIRKEHPNVQSQDPAYAG